MEFDGINCENQSNQVNNRQYGQTLNTHIGSGIRIRFTGKHDFLIIGFEDRLAELEG
jgi:hypothetical protein